MLSQQSGTYPFSSHSCTRLLRFGHELVPSFYLAAGGQIGFEVITSGEPQPPLYPATEIDVGKVTNYSAMDDKGLSGNKGPQLIMMEERVSYVYVS